MFLFLIVLNSSRANVDFGTHHVLARNELNATVSFFLDFLFDLCAYWIIIKVFPPYFDCDITLRQANVVDCLVFGADAYDPAPSSPLFHVHFPLSNRSSISCSRYGTRGIVALMLHSDNSSFKIFSVETK